MKRSIVPLNGKMVMCALAFATAHLFATAFADTTLTADANWTGSETTALTGRINLNGHTLTIISLKHKNRKGWPTKWAYNDRGIYPGTDADGNPGKIVWMPRGLMIMVK